MWYCDPHGDLQHMEPRDILKRGHLDFTQCRVRPRGDDKTDDDPTRGAADYRGLFD